MLISTRFRAFTLIEIMIVIAIIGILAGLTLPNYVRSRNEAHLTSCQQNLESLGAAYTTYLIRNKDKISDISQLIENGYISALPKCPAAGTCTYQISYDNDSVDSVVLYCQGDNHKGINVKTDYPRWMLDRRTKVKYNK